MHADTLRLMIVQAHPSACQPTPSAHPQPIVACGPPCGGQMRVVMCLWTSHRGFVDPGWEAWLWHHDLGSTRSVKTTAPVRPHHAIRQHRAA